MTTPLAFRVAIGLGACLLFQVQFLLARLLLPWFGGAPAVWSTSLVVFQALLLVGYGYAHVTASVRSRRTQVLLHLILVASVVASIAWRAAAWPSPVTPGDEWKPPLDGAPVPRIAWLLGCAAGLPFVLLASTSPLLQHWYADWTASHGVPGRAYRLYAVSNLGSLVGLLSYPLVIEPRLDLFEQGWWWSGALMVQAAAVLICINAVRQRPAARSHPQPVAPAPAPAPEPEPEPDAATPGPGLADASLWVSLAAVPAMLLQATTSRLTIDVAAVPLLWMLPLATYLLTFIVAFEYTRLHRRTLMAVLVAVAAVLALQDVSTMVSGVLTLAGLAVVGLAMHGELAARAPGPRHLTRYFLLVSTGGVVGSALVAFGAPTMFSGVHEYPLSFVAALGVLALVHARGLPKPEPATSGSARLIAAALAVLALSLGIHTVVAWRWSGEQTRHASRNFYGAIRVRDLDLPGGGRYRSFAHGTTMHGAQFLDAERARVPAAYFSRDSGIGRAMAIVQADGPARRIGVLGQGAGTIAAYGRAGDVLTFFEIDPDVTALSAGRTPLFTYVRDSSARVTVVTGDGRLALERADPYQFDMLVMDAFSSDAVPVHLLTREAMAVYSRHLRDDRSLIVVNVTNRYLDLHDVVAAAARTMGMGAVRIDQDAAGDLVEGTSWMILSRDADRLAALGPAYQAAPVRPWTDAFSNLLGVIRW